MRTRKIAVTGGALALCFALALPAPVAAQNPFESAPREAGRARTLEVELEALTQALREKVPELEKLRQTYTPESIAVQRAEREVAALRTRIAALEGERATALRRSHLEQPNVWLSRPVSVELRDATVRQAAEALAKVAGVNVVADENLPADKRLTVDARRVPLGTVLEAIALQNNLMIAPAPGGVALAPWPTLVVGAETQVLRGPLAPWSDEWAGQIQFQQREGGGRLGFQPAAPAAGGMMMGGGFAGGGFPGVGGPAGGLGGQGAGGFGGGLGGLGAGGGRGGGVGGFGAGGGMGGFIVPDGFSIPPTVGGVPLPGAASITSLAPHWIVVAEPGASPSGVRGTWLTVYRLDGTQLRRVSRLFHEPAAPAAAAPGDPFGRPARPAGPHPAPAPADGERKLTLSMRDAPLRAVIEQVFAGSGRGYTIAPNVPDVPITLSLRDVSLETALRTVIRQASASVPGLTHAREGDVYVIRIRPNGAVD
jgi:hypothetical protein